MAERIHVAHVGAPDPEKKNSPIVEETDEGAMVLTRDAPEMAVCYFNGTAYEDERLVCSGSELLRCSRGLWVREGSCDPDNP